MCVCACVCLFLESILRVVQRKTKRKNGGWLLQPVLGVLIFQSWPFFARSQSPVTEVPDAMPAFGVMPRCFLWAVFVWDLNEHHHLVWVAVLRHHAGLIFLQGGPQLSILPHGSADRMDRGPLPCPEGALSDFGLRWSRKETDSFGKLETRLACCLTCASIRVPK